MADDNMDLAWFKMDSSIVIQTNCGSILIPDDVRTLHFRIDMLIHLHLIKHVNLTWFDVNFFPLQSTIRKGDSTKDDPVESRRLVLNPSREPCFASLHVSFWFLSGGLIEIYWNSPQLFWTLASNTFEPGFFVITTQADAGPNRPNPALALRLSMVIPVLMPSGS